MREVQQHTLETIWGHSNIKSLMERLITSGRLPHAMLLAGPEGIGKKSLAFALAKQLLVAASRSHSASLRISDSAPHRVNFDGGSDEEPDLFGGGDEPDLFGSTEEPDLFGAAPEPEKNKEETPAPPPPLERPKADTKPAPPQVDSAPKRDFTELKARILRLVEASYPLQKADSSGGHADLTIIEPVGNSRSIRVDQIREFQNLANIPPIEGKYRVVLVFGIDTVTQEAANSILKILEEPPEYLILILVTNRLHQVLQTIRSRCALLTLYPLARQELVDHLIEDEKLEPELAKLCASLSEGCPGVALNLAHGGALQARRDVFEARLLLERFGTLAITGAAAQLSDAGGLEETLNLLLSFCRDRLVEKLHPNSKFLIHDDQKDLLVAEAEDAWKLAQEAERLLEALEMTRRPFVPNTRAVYQQIYGP